jgi:hypothetical protein
LQPADVVTICDLEENGEAEVVANCDDLKQATEIERGDEWGVFQRLKT